MKLSATASAIVLLIAASAGLLLPVATFAQAAVGPATQREKDLYQRIAVLQSKLATQNARMDALDAKLAAQQKGLDSAVAQINARPKGYAKAFITLGNLGRLPPTDGISYWARQ